MPDIAPAILHRHRRRALELLDPETGVVLWMMRWVDLGVDCALKDAQAFQHKLNELAIELAWSEQRRRPLIGIERGEYIHLEEARRLLYNELTEHKTQVDLKPVHEVWLKYEEELRKPT